MPIRRRALFAQILVTGLTSLLLTNRDRAFAENVQYEYDALGRLIKVTYGDGSTTTYAYDPAGNRTTVVQATTFNQTIAITAGRANLRSLADAAGYDGARNANVTFTVASGTTISGSLGFYGVETGSWPTESHSIALTLEISGAVHGSGGRGGAGGASTVAGQIAAGADGGRGGDGIFCRAPINIIVKPGGVVRGGGGGGRGGDGYGGPPSRGGGGGGGGAPNGLQGSGGTGDIPGSPGSRGTASGPGAGGSGYQAGFSGGAFGANGGGATGGEAGYAIRKNGRAVSVTNNGTIVGMVG